jgi:1-acyl-sn-glycerol-3-phosphate acyltransferase
VAGLSSAVRRLSVVGARLVYREIEVVAHGELPDGPVLLASNHFGGAADALLLIALNERFPRIVARDLIWKVPLVGSLMRSIGAIPVARRADQHGVPRSNDDMFAACYDALQREQLVLIFPEGVTQDDPFLAPVRTGAARIVLGARNQGVSGIHLVPVGIHYEDKAAFRSRVLVAFGAPIPLDETAVVLEQAAGLEDGRRLGPDDQDAVRSVTDLLGERLRGVGPHYRDWEQARAMHLAASVTLRELTPAETVRRETPFGLTERLGAALAARPPQVQAAVQDAAVEYQEGLSELGVDDQAVAGRRPFRLGRLVAEVALLLLLLPLAALGLLLAAIPLLLTQATRLVPTSPAMLSTIMPLVATLSFVVEWVVITVGAARQLGWDVGAAAAVLAPVAVAATLYVAERAVLLIRGLRRWWRIRRRADPILGLRDERAALLAATRAALEGEAA